jgi:hypothetical protein
VGRMSRTLTVTRSSVCLHHFTSIALKNFELILLLMIYSVLSERTTQNDLTQKTDMGLPDVINSTTKLLMKSGNQRLPSIIPAARISLRSRQTEISQKNLS